MSAILEALEAARVFVSDELEVRRRSYEPNPDDDQTQDIDSARSVLAGIEAAIAALSAPYQDRVMEWSVACFGAERANDIRVRNCRFLEEALELVQSGGLTRDDCILLVDYVFARPVGDLPQEVGGTMVTLAALCAASIVDLNGEAERELARVWTKIEKIRAKQAEKDRRIPVSPLPMEVTPDTRPGPTTDELAAEANAAGDRILARQRAEERK